MYGCSEEVPSLKAQLLCEEILSLCLNKREAPGLGLMAALEGDLRRESEALQGAQVFSLGLTCAYFACSAPSP